MKIIYYILILCLFVSCQTKDNNIIASSPDYLQSVKSELIKEWPHNRTINLVFHGHSVPAGYFKTPFVNSLESYPYLVLKKLKDIYPYAVINIIVCAKGGENSEQGAIRFDSDVLSHKPDILFIDYALNDVVLGVERSNVAWEKMIKKALQKNIKILLLTPSPDQRFDIKDNTTELAKQAQQIRDLSSKYNIALVDSYKLFQELPIEQLNNYMAQVNHPNEKGHQMIADEIMKYFK